MGILEIWLGNRGYTLDTNVCHVLEGLTIISDDIAVRFGGGKSKGVAQKNPAGEVEPASIS